MCSVKSECCISRLGPTTFLLLPQAPAPASVLEKKRWCSRRRRLPALLPRDTTIRRRLRHAGLPSGRLPSRLAACFSLGSRRSRCRRELPSKTTTPSEPSSATPIATPQASVPAAQRNPIWNFDCKVRCPKSPKFSPRRPLQVADMPCKHKQRPCDSVPTDRRCRAWCNPRYKMPCEGLLLRPAGPSLADPAAPLTPNPLPLQRLGPRADPPC